MKSTATEETVNLPAIKTGKSQNSILSGQSGRERVDSHGNPITKGSKSHRCSFRDEHDQTLCVHDVKEVTAYKTPYFGADYREDDKQGCACTVM
mmetsp:Transcript_40856/g.113606  ORF Transcript_40856/g.113606 Transcript_40856/m.113606 type:complete len:94 (+) Transcript_40856:103-384(+)